MADDVDTVTPLDGDGHNVTGISEQFENPRDAVESGNVSVKDYETRGRTTVATRRGYRFAPSDKDIPVITHEGVKVTAEQAATLAKESDDLVFVRADASDEEGE